MCVIALSVAVGLSAQASTISELQQKIAQEQQNINKINSAISSLSDEQDLIEEKIEDINAEIINTMTSIGLKEEEIAEKETQISQKQLEIVQAQADYEVAKQKEEDQYAAMKVRIQFMYENSNTSLLSMFLDSGDFSDMINKADYVESVYEYDQKMLDEYEATKNQVQALWNQLELDKATLESDKSALESDRAALQRQRSELDTLLTQKKKESANFEAEIQKYRQEAAAAKKRISQEQQQIRALQAQQRSTAKASATSGSYNVTAVDTSVITNAGGSELGKKIAQYGCQYVGNPYVLGGTSLTSGADCSGFTYRIYKDFGYNLPRTSFEQRSTGSSVSYDQAQPGDLICYEGHVGLYIGGGYIVHASSARTGIKISQATYRPILAVRRIV